MQPLRHFLHLTDIPRADLQRLLDDAREERQAFREGRGSKRLGGKTIGLLFEQPSTRTRISFDLAVRQQGGLSLVLPAQDLHLRRGETVADTARILTLYTHGFVLRTSSHDRLEAAAAAAGVPVLNGLSPLSHPCQLLADILTLQDHLGRRLAGRRVVWLGVNNNVTRSWMEAALLFDFHLVISTPDVPELAPDRSWMSRLAARVPSEGSIHYEASPDEAVRKADVVVSDTWDSLGDSALDAPARAERDASLRPYQVDSRKMALAAPGAFFLHCLPAYRGREVSQDVLEGSQSLVWEAAENRLHTQKSLLAWCLRVL